MVLRSLSECHFVMMIKFGPYFCVGDENLKLAKPHIQGLCIGWRLCSLQ